MRGFLKGIDTTIRSRNRPPVNVVDSSGWLEYLADGPNADFFAKSIITTSDLVVPTLSLYEVFKRVLQQRGEDDALQAVALMQQGTIVELNAPLALKRGSALVSTKKFRWQMYHVGNRTCLRSDPVEPGFGLRKYCRGKVHSEEMSAGLLLVEMTVNCRQRSAKLPERNLVRKKSFVLRFAPCSSALCDFRRRAAAEESPTDRVSIG